MKQVILDVLEDVTKGQVNLKSEATREMIVNLIMASIKTNGWYLDLGTHHDDKDDDNLDTAGHPVKKINKWLTRDIDEVQIIGDVCSHGNDLNNICHKCDDEFEIKLSKLDKAAVLMYNINKK